MPLLPSPPPADPVAPAELEPFDRLPALGAVEIDRFCEGCAYNLHGQTVRRDPRTALLLVRCPECGRYACATDLSSAGRTWVRRFSVWLLGQWLVLLLALVAGYVFFQWVNTMVFSDEMVRLAQYGRTASRYGRNVGQEYFMMSLACGTVSAALGFCFSVLFVSLVPHWKRAGYLALAVALPALSALAAFVVWGFYATYQPERSVWQAQSFIVQLWIIATACGMLGVPAGRPLARLVVRLLLPPKLRGPLGYLWTADGLPRPGTTEPGKLEADQER